MLVPTRQQSSMDMDSATTAPAICDRQIGKWRGNPSGEAPTEGLEKKCGQDKKFRRSQREKIAPFVHCPLMPQN